MSFSSDEVNFLVYRYLQESGNSDNKQTYMNQNAIFGVSSDLISMDLSTNWSNYFT